MPDQEGRTSGPGTKTPDQAYKEGRSEDVQPGSLGADTGGAGEQVSRLTQDADAGSEAGTTQSGGFAGQQADDSPDAGTVSPAGSGEEHPKS